MVVYIHQPDGKVTKKRYKITDYQTKVQLCLSNLYDVDSAKISPLNK